MVLTLVPPPAVPPPSPSKSSIATDQQDGGVPEFEMVIPERTRDEDIPIPYAPEKSKYHLCIFPILVAFILIFRHQNNVN